MVTDDELEALRVTAPYYLKEINSGQRAGPGQDGGRRAGQHRRGRDVPGVGPGRGRARGSCPARFMAKRVLTELRFFWNSPQGPEPDATGYKGFYYHFLDMETGRRVWQCELSTIDSAFLFAGMLTAATYFDQDTEDEHEIRTLADALYRRADWQLGAERRGDADARLEAGERLHPLPLGGLRRGAAPVRARPGLADATRCPPESYAAYTSTYQWKKIYGHEYLYSGPLFTHQLSHMWIDFRGIQDAFMRDRGIDYFENSRRATYVHQQYAIRNPLEFEGYGERCWGLTASDGPGWTARTVKGIERRFFDYVARGAPTGPTTARSPPGWWSPPCPSPRRSCCRPLRHFGADGPGHARALTASRRPSTGRSRSRGATHGWVTPYHFGIDQGPIVLMIENYRTGSSLGDLTSLSDPHQGTPAGRLPGRLALTLWSVRVPTLREERFGLGLKSRKICSSTDGSFLIDRAALAYHWMAWFFSPDFQQASDRQIQSRTLPLPPAR